MSHRIRLMVSGLVMHIESLKIYCDLIETKVLALAAERNFVTPSAIKQQLAALEVRFGRKLVDPLNGRQRLNPTPAGEAFYRQAKTVLASFAELQKGMPGPGGMIARKVRVLAPYCIGYYEMPAKMREFMTRFPSARIDLVFGRAKQVIREVLEGTAELGIVAFPEPDRRFTSLQIASDRMVLICSPEHEIADRRQIRINELNGLTLVAFERNTPTRKATDKILASQGVCFDKYIEFGDLESIKTAVALGFGIGIVPQASVLNKRDDERLATVKLAGDEWERPVAVIYRRNKTLSFPAKKFVNSLGNRTIGRDVETYEGEDVDARPLC